MKESISPDKEILEPINQLNIFGYESYFDFFEKLYQKNKLPNSILLSGAKGLGKATFLYHFINYLLSKDEEYKYDRKKFLINPKNQTYKLIKSQAHTNLFTLDSHNEEKIKIEQIRQLLLFLNKSAYYKGIKIILIDNAEFLNINSSNALLKAIEEPSNNTFFFIINNDSKKILNTIKSRCIDFKINFSMQEKKKAFLNIAKSYDLNFNESDLNNFFRFDTQGNLLRYLVELKGTDFTMSENCYSCITYFIDLYNAKNDPKILNYISLFAQNFYSHLSLKNSFSIPYYYKNLNKILYLIDNTKKFHLDKKNLVFSINKIIRNER